VTAMTPKALLPSCLRRGGTASADGVVLIDGTECWLLLQTRLTTRVSPPVLGGVAAASADGVVLIDGTECWLLLQTRFTTRVSPPVLGGVAAASVDGAMLFRHYISEQTASSPPK